MSITRNAQAILEVGMKVLVLNGALRRNGNTTELCRPFIEELNKKGVEVEVIFLKDRTIASCKGCFACQEIISEYGCVQQDDMIDLAKAICAADCVVYATPIYTWFCTAPMKAVLDRGFGLNKFYGKQMGSLWKGKKIAILATHGYDAECGVDLFENAMKRLCNHSELHYLGIYSAKDEDDLASFQEEGVINGAIQFAHKILSSEC